STSTTSTSTSTTKSTTSTSTSTSSSSSSSTSTSTSTSSSSSSSSSTSTSTSTSSTTTTSTTTTTTTATSTTSTTATTHSTTPTPTPSSPSSSSSPSTSTSSTSSTSSRSTTTTLPACPENSHIVLTQVIIDPSVLAPGGTVHSTVADAVNHAEDGDLIGMFTNTHGNVVIGAPGSPSAGKGFTIIHCAQARIDASSPANPNLPALHIAAAAGAVIISGLDLVNATGAEGVLVDGNLADLKGLRVNNNGIGALIGGTGNRAS